MKNATIAQLAWTWMIDKKLYIVPIPGTRKLKQLKENAGASEILWTQEEVEQIDKMLAGVKVINKINGLGMRVFDNHI